MVLPDATRVYLTDELVKKRWTLDEGHLCETVKSTWTILHEVGKCQAL